MFTEPGSAREEAERLVAAGLAFASLAANAHPEIANGSAACCVCPFCKLIDAVRDPDPQVVERIAAGAGDLAVGLAGLLRSLSSMTRSAADPWSGATGGSARTERAEPSAGAGFETAGGAGFTAAGGDAATAAGAGFETAGSAGFDSASAAAQVAQDSVAKKAVAKKAIKKAVPPIVPESGMAAGPHDGVEAALTAAKPLVKKAIAQKAIKKAMPKPTPGASG